MELELKILREKVIEDEQKSGIGNLYDDDKTSHQHITLLKTKYAQMKRDFDRNLQDLAKQALKVKGQEFVLDAQIMIVKEQTKQLKLREGEFTDNERKVQSELTYANRENSRQQMGLESELKGLSNGCNESETTHFEHKIHQDKERAFDEESKKRHDLEVDLVSDLRTRK